MYRSGPYILTVIYLLAVSCNSYEISNADLAVLQKTIGAQKKEFLQQRKQAELFYNSHVWQIVMFHGSRPEPKITEALHTMDEIIGKTDTLIAMIDTLIHHVAGTREHGFLNPSPDKKLMQKVEQKFITLKHSITSLPYYEEDNDFPVDTELWFDYPIKNMTGISKTIILEGMKTDIQKVCVFGLNIIYNKYNYTVIEDYFFRGMVMVPGLGAITVPKEEKGHTTVKLHPRIYMGVPHEDWNNTPAIKSIFYKGEKVLPKLFEKTVVEFDPASEEEMIVEFIYKGSLYTQTINRDHILEKLWLDYVGSIRNEQTY